MRTLRVLAALLVIRAVCVVAVADRVTSLDLGRQLQDGSAVFLAVAFVIVFTMHLGRSTARAGIVLALAAGVPAAIQLFWGGEIVRHFDVAIVLGRIGIVGWWGVLLMAQLGERELLPRAGRLAALAATFGLAGLIVASMSLPSGLQLPRWLLLLLHGSVPVGVAILLLKAKESVVEEHAPGLADAPALFRVLAAIVGVRVVFAAAGVCLPFVVSRSDAYFLDATLGAWLLATIIDVVSLALVWRYARLPRGWRGRWMDPAFVMYACSIALSSVAAFQSFRLMVLMHEAQRGTSFWGMPSVTAMEQMQMIATWCLRASWVCGLVAALAMTDAAKASAQAMSLDGVREQVASLRAMIGACAGVVVFATLAETNLRDVPLSVLASTGFLLEALGLTAAFQWFRIFRRLAIKSSILLAKT